MPPARFETVPFTARPIPTPREAIRAEMAEVSYEHKNDENLQKNTAEVAERAYDGMVLRSPVI